MRDLNTIVVVFVLIAGHVGLWIGLGSKLDRQWLAHDQAVTCLQATIDQQQETRKCVQSVLTRPPTAPTERRTGFLEAWHVCASTQPAIKCGGV